MTSRIKAINAYRPRIKLKGTVGNDDLVEFIARSTGLNESGVSQVLLELRDATLFFTRRGNSVKIQGLGTYTPTIDLEGTLKMSHRADMDLKNGLNAQGKFSGDILNQDNIGKTGDELVAMWDADHPDDLVA